MRHEFLIVLPARYGSTRLPGKPLIDICGKSMIVRSYQNIINQTKDVLEDIVLVATDDERIRQECVEHNIPVEMTRKDHKTGTDRVAEVSNRYPEFPFIINAQPDEPLLADGVIARIKDTLRSDDFPCCGMAPIVDPEQIDNPNVGKVVIDRYGFALYMSRSPIPYNSKAYFTQVCVYGFPRHHLMQYHRLKRGVLEQMEEIELLRFLENHAPVRMVAVPGSRMSVDTPEDVERVRKAFLEINNG